MSRNKTQIGEIRYNPAEQCFEALVTFHGTTGTRRIPASFAAPLSADFDLVAKGLMDRATATINRPEQMKSRLERMPTPAPKPQLSGFDWQSLLHGSRAA